MNMIRKVSFVLLTVTTTCFLTQCTDSSTANNSDKTSASTSATSNDPIDQKVEELISKMTIEEKVGEMTQLTLGFLSSSENQHDGKEKKIDEGKLKEAIQKYHVGSILNSAGNAYSLEKWHGIIKQVQDLALENPNKIPVLYGIDAIHGVTYTKESTLFPHNLAMGATRNTSLVKQAAKITALETRASGIRWDFDPVLDVGREPLWPRFPETFGEDGFLCGVMGTTAIQGYEEDGLDQITSVASCMKHFVGYSVPRSGKDRTEAFISDIEMWEHHLPQFKKAVEAGSSTIMINSASVNGMPVHASHYLLTEVLREQFGFEGVIVTDWEDIIRLHERHRVAKTPREAVKIGILAGLDMSMVPNRYDFCEHLVALVKDGEITEERINESVRRILKLKFKLGLFENAYVEEAAIANFGKPEHDQVALDAALESIVLLKNENNALPLSKSDKVLVAGPCANNLGPLNGSWSFSWQGKAEQEYPDRYLTVAESIEKLVGSENVINASVPGFDNEANYDTKTLVAKANQVDKIILCLGENAYAESPGVIDELKLDENQMRLAKAAFETGKPVVLVLIEGRPRIIRKLEPECSAIVLGLQPGSKGGPAIAQVLYGDYNPDGILPFTYHKYSGDIIPYDHKYLSAIQQRTPGKMTYEGYRPQWPFGHGLSYTTFDISDITLNKMSFSKSDGLIEASVTVTNTGDRDGKKALDLFIRDHYASIAPSVRKLKGFAKEHIKAGESKKIKFGLNVADLAFNNDKGEMILEPGKFSIMIGDKEVEFEVTE